MAPILLLLLLLPAFSANASPAPATTPEDVCRTINYPARCDKLLKTYHPKTVHDLLEAAVTDAIAQLRDAQAKNEALTKQLGPKSEYGHNTQVCAKEYGDAADMLEEHVVGPLKKGAVIDAMYPSSVSSGFGICYDIFDTDGEYGGEMKFPGSDIFKNMLEVAGNLMTVTCAMYPDQCPST